MLQATGNHRAEQSSVAVKVAQRQAVYAEQIQLLYHNALVGSVVTIVNGIIVVMVLWHPLPRTLLSTWLVANTLAGLARLPLVWRYRRASPAQAAERRWGCWYTAGAVVAGATWGAIAVIGTLYLSLPHQVFVAFVVGGMAIGAIAVNSSHLPAYVGFLLPALVPLALGFFLQARGISIAMGALTLVFTGALFVLGRHVNGSIRRSIELAQEKQSLLDTLHAAHRQTIESNQRLAREVEAHQATAAELRERVGLYRAMFEKNEAVKLLIDPETGAIEDANPAASRFYGYPLEVLKKARITDINTLPSKDVFESMALAKIGDQGRFEFHHRLASGEVRDVEVHSSPIELRGRLLLFSIVYDITERKRAEAALRRAHEQLERRVMERTEDLLAANDRLWQEVTERRRTEQALRRSEELFRATFEQAAVGIAHVDTDGKWLQVNQKLCDILGYSYEELLKLTFQDITHPDDLDANLDYFRQALAGEVDSYAMNKRYLRKDGTTVWANLTVSLVRSNEGEPKNFISIIEDINDRKRAEELLFQEKERAEVTLHCIGDAVITTNAAGVIEYLNPVAETLTGWPLQLAREQPLESVFCVVDETNREPVRNPVLQCLEERRLAGLAEHSLLISRQGREYPIEDSAAPIYTRNGDIVGAVLVFHDVTEARRLQHRLIQQATHDALTGLVNRREFERRLERALASAKRHGSQHALCYLDLDRFKIVNDTAGHQAGDFLLKEVADRLMNQVRARDTLARLGGDEFSLLVENCPPDNALRIAEGLVASIRDYRFVWEGEPFTIGVSVGLVPIAAEAQSIAHLLMQADAACYTAKRLGGNRVHLSQGQLAEGAERPAEQPLAVVDLRCALERDRFRLYQQPIVALSADGSGRTLHELLLRLVDAKDHIVLPETFLPAAERCGLMGAIDRWVIQRAFKVCAEQLAGWPNVQIAINLSGSSLNDDSLRGFVQAMVSEHELAPGQICFEITETSALYNLSQAAQLIADLKADGFAFALDHFGSGLLSLDYLRRLPLDYLKIGGNLIRDLNADPVSHSMVAAINQVSHAIGIQTVAECVESAVVADELRRLGIDYAQGYALSLPTAFEDLHRDVIGLH